jgi:hypothetical protein
MPFPAVAPGLLRAQDDKRSGISGARQYIRGHSADKCRCPREFHKIYLAKTGKIVDSIRFLLNVPVFCGVWLSGAIGFPLNRNAFNGVDGGIFLHDYSVNSP